MAGFLDVKGRVCNTRNNVTDAAGYAIPPLASNLAQGQIAVHTSDTDPCLFFKTTSEKIVKIPTEAVLVKALTDILGNSAADLDTLRELIAQFEGSANDILPMLVALTDRVSEAETTLGNKANSSVVNAHIQNTSNPHGVTASQVGLGNVVNKEQLGKNENAVSATVAKYQIFIQITGFVGKKVSEAKAQMLTVISQNVDKGSFILNLQTFGMDLVNNWSNDEHILGAGNTYYYAEVTCASAGLFAFLKLTTYASRAFYTTYITTGGFGPMSRVMHIGDTATNSDQLGGIPSGQFWHQGNSNLSTVNWSANRLTAKGGLFSDASASPLTLERTDSDANIGLTFKGKTISKSLGTTNGELRFGDTVDLAGSGKTVYHAGNSNKSDVNWVTRNLDAFGTITCKSSYYIGNNRVIVSNGMDLYLGGLDTEHSGIVVFRSKGLERLRISNNGNVGINNTNPTEKLDVIGNGKFSGNTYVGGNVESNGSGIFTGDIVSKKIGAVVFAANDQSGGSATRLNDLQDVKLPANLSAKMIMAYDPAQINLDGTKGGYTFMPAVGVGTGKVVADDIESLPDLNLIGSTYVAASDKRLKENIRPLTGATNILLNFAPKEYEWNSEGRKLGLTDPRAYGLIAQEAAELKDIVDIVRPMSTSNYLGVDYVKIIPILIAGFQELHNELGTVNRKIDSIRTRANKSFGMEDANAQKITTLEAEVAELKRLIRN